MILLGKQIKEFRKKYKLTQTELADQVGVTKSTIAAYENDSRQPSYDVLVKLADVFRISVDSLLLNRTEVIIAADGLTLEQIDIINNLITYFRKNNSLEESFSKLSPELRKMIKEYLATKKEDER